MQFNEVNPYVSVTQFSDEQSEIIIDREMNKSCAKMCVGGSCFVLNVLTTFGCSAAGITALLSGTISHSTPMIIMGSAGIVGAFTSLGVGLWMLAWCQKGAHDEKKLEWIRDKILCQQDEENAISFISEDDIKAALKSKELEKILDLEEQINKKEHLSLEVLQKRKKKLEASLERKLLHKQTDTDL